MAISIFSVIVAAIFQTWSYLALVYAIKDSQENIGAKQSYLLSWKNILSYWWISFLMGFISVGGFFLLIIPGFIFAIWFVFAPIILVMEGAKGMSALLKSKYYVKGKLISLAWRFFAVFLIIFFLFALLYLITSANNILFQTGSTIFSFIIFPFVIIYYFLIYTYLKKTKGDFVFTPTPKEKKKFVFVGILGIILPILLIVASLFFLKQAFVKWDTMLDAERTSDINLISTAMNAYYEKNGKYPEVKITKERRINLSNIGQNLMDVPSDPGLGKIKGCNDVRGASYLGFDNISNRDKYCIFTCLNDSSFFAASHKGVKILDKMPINLDCWQEEKKTDETFGWKTYTNNEHGFEMKYPENFFFSEPKITTTSCDYLDFSKQCPYVPVPGFNIENEKDLEAATEKGLIKIEKVKINDRNYCLQQSSEGAAGSIYTNYYYTTVKNDKCISLNLVLYDINCGVLGSADEENYKKCEDGKIKKSEILDKIIFTFKFLK
ncbi:MAG: hypothetical protein NTU58_03100 [Candidatus Nealsonbacteria bacterium]|nr:hypothetical protein [Candidatus Nealsonbacteria bacterium]